MTEMTMSNTWQIRRVPCHKRKRLMSNAVGQRGPRQLFYFYFTQIPLYTVHPGEMSRYEKIDTNYQHYIAAW